MTSSADPLVEAAAVFPGRSSRALAAAADLLDGLFRTWLWTTLAHQDLKLRYRGSILGPFWQTITTCVMIGAMGFIYAKLFHTPMEDYLPMLAAGLVFWQFTSGMITEGCGTFYSVQGIIQQVKLPFSLHAYRLVYRNLLILMHNFVIIPIVLAMFWKPIAWLQVLALGPALALILLNGVWVSILLGMISARFRDVPPIVASIVQVLFFVTPIFWPVSALGENQWVAEFNPISAAIDVMRAPLLGQLVEPYSWPILIMVTVFGCAGTFAFFARFRSRIAYWV